MGCPIAMFDYQRVVSPRTTWSQFLDTGIKLISFIVSLKKYPDARPEKKRQFMSTTSTAHLGGFTWVMRPFFQHFSDFWFQHIQILLILMVISNNM